VYQTLMAMRPGQVSEPLQTMSGWHIMELLDTREIDRTEEAIRAEAREKIRRQRAEQEVEKVLRQFRDEAYVEIRLPGQQRGSG
jgi:peptidyl-prolyl cis-trans isomerase SurA